MFYLTMFVLLILSSVVNGLVLKIMWEWFVADTFGLPSLTIPLAIGLSIVVGFLTYQDSTTDKTSPESKSEAERTITLIAYGIIRPMLVLGLARIVYQFV